MAHVSRELNPDSCRRPSAIAPSSVCRGSASALDTGCQVMCGIKSGLGCSVGMSCNPCHNAAPVSLHAALDAPQKHTGCEPYINGEPGESGGRRLWDCECETDRLTIQVNVDGPGGEGTYHLAEHWCQLCQLLQLTFNILCGHDSHANLISLGHNDLAVCCICNGA